MHPRSVSLAVMFMTVVGCMGNDGLPKDSLYAQDKTSACAGADKCLDDENSFLQTVKTLDVRNTLTPQFQVDKRVPIIDDKPGHSGVHSSWNIDASGLKHCKNIFTDEDADCQTDQEEYVDVGCFKKDPADLGGSKSTNDLKGEHFIDTCMNHTVDLCLSGFPFYQWENVDSGKNCSQRCVDKGLDLAAYFQEQKMCRCGASALNHQIWPEDPHQIGTHLTIESLYFKPSKLSHSESCELQVLRYGGTYTREAIPPGKVTTLHEVDIEYTDMITTGKSHPEEDTPDDPGDSSLIEVADQDEKSGGPNWQRNCWPHDCGRRQWPTRQSDPSNDAADIWQEYVTIPFWFESNVDWNRKTAFKSAAALWRDNTCINLVEQDHYSKPIVKVGIYTPSSCFGGLGYPGQWSDSRVNLGWCNSDRHVYNMVHEIGHVIGLRHTHLRPDAYQEYWKKGPYLKIHWQNLPNGWASGWQPDWNQYTGSADDGQGDPFIGYAPYDFDSIMHTSARNRIDTFPDWQKWNLGQRDHLSKLDILQVLDVYQCKWKEQKPSSIQWKPHPSKCLDVSGGHTSNGNNIHLWDCQSGIKSQIFEVNQSQIRLQAHPGKCLDVSGGSSSNGNNIQIWDCDSGSINQRFAAPTASGQIRWAGRSPAKCLDVSGGSSSNGNNIHLWDCVGESPNQQFTFVNN